MGDQESALSPNDLQQLVMVLNCLKEGALTVSLQEIYRSSSRLIIFQNALVDVPKFAKKAGLTAGSAKNVLIRLRKKLDDIENGEDADVTSPPSPPSDGKAKKAPAKQNPEKKPQAPRKKKEAKVEANEDDEEETA